MIWDQRYAEDGYAYGAEPNDFVVEQAGALRRGRVLCLAEGEGRNAVYLAGLGHETLAVDASAVGLATARELAAQKGVALQTLVADLADFAIEPESFDTIVSIWCHVPPDLRRALHRRVVAGLRPGGTLLLEAYTPRQLEFKTGGPPVAEMMMQLSDLRQELDGLELLIGRECEREIHEGKYHNGMSHVVQVLARKPEPELSHA